jgi:putative transposase
MPSEFRPFDVLPEAHSRRRELPHWTTPGATYFVTFRLADALPAQKRAELEKRKRTWLKANGLEGRIDPHQLPWTLFQEFRRQITIYEDAALDEGFGACALRHAEIRAPLMETMLAWDVQRYALDAYVIMPNHVHAILQPTGEWTVGQIMGTWKKYAALRANRLRGKTGAFWQNDSFDHIVRDREHLDRFRRYIARNPARLPQGQYALGVGSGIQ